MPNAVRWLLAAVLVVLVVGLPVALTRYQYAHTKRFHEVTPGRFYRAGQMTAGGFRETIARDRIKCVINLQHEDPDPFLPEHWLGTRVIRESELCRQLGVKYVLITPDVLPPGNRLDVLPPSVDEFLAVLDDEANYPILLHCRAGLHRTGRLAAIYRMEYQHWSKGESLRELRANGYGFTAASEADAFIIQFVQNYTPRAQRPKLLPVAPPPRVAGEKRAEHVKVSRP